MKSVLTLSIWLTLGQVVQAGQCSEFQRLVKQWQAFNDKSVTYIYANAEEPCSLRKQTIDVERRLMKYKGTACAPGNMGRVEEMLTSSEGVYKFKCQAKPKN